MTAARRREKNARIGSFRVATLPPNIFAEIEWRKEEARSRGRDVIDLGFGNPDTPSPEVAVTKLAEAVTDPRTHRYSSSKGVLELREAIVDRYVRCHGVTLDPDRQVVATIGATEGLAHLVLAIVDPGDVVIVPSPSYPIHLQAPMFAGAAVCLVGLDGFGTDEHETGRAFYERFANAWYASKPKPRFAILSFPNNPTTVCIDLETMARLVHFARENDLILIHDFAYADTSFDGYRPPSILEVNGAHEVAVEIYSMTKSFSMAGWRMAFVIGNEAVVQSLTNLKTYLDYGSFEPIQLATAAALRLAPDYPTVINSIYLERRNALCDGLGEIDWPVLRPKGTMFVWARIPGYVPMDSVDFATFLVDEAAVCTSPGGAFGPEGNGHLRFALIETAPRISEAIDRIRAALKKL